MSLQEKKTNHHYRRPSQVSVSLTSKNTLSSIADFSLCVLPPSAEGSLVEIDNLNMAPTTTSVLLMAFLDTLGVLVAQQSGLDMHTFQLMHPGGSLGASSRHAVDAVVIVASGSGSRLMPMTAHIPKVLVSVLGRPFLFHLLDYHARMSPRVVVVVQSHHAELVAHYTRLYASQLRTGGVAMPKIEVRMYDHLNGTAATLASTLNHLEHGNNLLITWCDIVPREPLPSEALGRTTVFLHGTACRYTATAAGELRVTPCADGGVVGMWMIRNFRGLHHYREGQDLADVFVENFGGFRTFEIKDLLDIGDLQKYNATHNGVGGMDKDAGTCRFFNFVQLVIPTSDGETIGARTFPRTTEIVRKTALTKHAQVLQTRELAWYAEVQARIPRGKECSRTVYLYTLRHNDVV